MSLSLTLKGDLVDQTTIDQNDIIPGTTVTMAIWPYNGWQEVVQAAATGNEYKVRALGCSLHRLICMI